MSHEEIQERLADYAAARLSPDQRRFVESHVAGCADCADAVEDLKEIGTQVRQGGESMFGPHPDPAALQSHAAGTSRATDPTLLEHLKVCPSCRLEVEHWTLRAPAAGTAGHPVARPPGRPAATLVLGMAAALLVGGFLGLRLGRQDRGGAPRSPAEPAASQANATPALPSGELVLHVLPAVLRGGDAPARTLTLPRPGSPLAVLVPVALSREAPGAEQFRVELRRSGGEAVWALDLSAAAIREHVDAAEGIYLTIEPAAPLQPGAYEFLVRTADRPDAPPIYRAAIAIAYRQSPAETNAPQ